MLQPVKSRGSTLNKVIGRGNGVANEGKRKKSEDQSGSLLKKTKLDQTSTVSSTKVYIHPSSCLQVNVKSASSMYRIFLILISHFFYLYKFIKVQHPKAKLGDKITALQQIVSPFGKVLKNT